MTEKEIRTVLPSSLAAGPHGLGRLNSSLIKYKKKNLRECIFLLI